MEKTQHPRLGLSADWLKWIAIGAMLIDHIGLVLLERGLFLQLGAQGLATEASLPWQRLDLLLRAVGRLTFPILCFLLVEGFLHTRDAKRYLRRLLLFALLSEIPFDLAVRGQAFDWTQQNSLWTFPVGLLMLLLLRRLEAASSPRLSQAAAVISCCVLAVWIQIDYRALGVLLIGLFYLLRGQKWASLSVALPLLWFAADPPLTGFAALALVPIACYDGKKRSGQHSLFFYWFYPAHLLLLAGVRWLWLGM